MDLTPARRKFLSKQNWAVSTAQEHTHNLITIFLANHCGVSYELQTKTIKYYKKPVLVYIVPFNVVEELITNRNSKQLQFVVYHDEKGDDLWVKWNEERKNMKSFITPRSALSFPQRRKRK